MAGGDTWLRGPELSIDHGPSPLTEESAGAIRAVLRRHASDALTSGELRLALRPLVQNARDAGCTVEHVLVEVKRAWGDLPEARRAATSHERARPLERVVTICIEMFYEQ